MIPDPEEFRRQGHRLVDQLTEFLAQVGTAADGRQKVIDYREPDAMVT